MEGRRIKKSVIYTMYIVAFILVMTSIYLMGMNATTSFQDDTIPLTYVSKSIFDNTKTVVKEVMEEEKVIKPFNDDNVEIKKNYYDYKDENEQEKSIIYYENTYMQSSGIFYVSNNSFDVVASLEGTVTSITEDDLLGKIVEIKHDNGLETLYEGLNEINVKVNDNVKAGTKIGTSGSSNLFKDDANGLYFEIISDGKNINPNFCFNKTIAEIKG